MSDSEQPRPPESAPVLSVLLQLLRLRGSPADLSGSPAILFWLLAIDAAISAVFLSASGSEGPIALDIALGLGLQLLLPWLLLYQLGKSARFLQTAIALIGVDVLLTIVLLPLASYGTQLASSAPTAGFTQLISLLFVAGVVWLVMVFGHIYRCALEFPLAGGILVTLGVLATQMIVGQMLLGSPA